MSTRILIDAAHVNETRLVICDDEEILEIDYQLSEKRRCKGNIYLGKVERIEPALQAAFVNYGGNKCGFLPLSEINTSYYNGGQSRNEKPKNSKNSSELSKDMPGDGSEEGDGGIAKRRRSEIYSKYNIQDFLKKDQELLVQVINDERGSKGVTLTTDISLYGRFIVFMPNSSRSNGVSKSIVESGERDRLLQVVNEISKNTSGTKNSILVRSSAIYRTKIEIKKDLAYLRSLWDNIQQGKAAAAAPAFIHEEGNIIIRAIRDLYHSEVEEIVIAGQGAYETACDFAELIIPRHVDKIKLYQGITGIFSHYNVENKVAALYGNTAILPSGGAIVINQTEALVSIDINSGKVAGTKNIEETATKTNIAATKEIAKQLKLRDLAGLIVIDFIDMENQSNIELVEKALAKELSSDKARLKIGKISEFGLLEMSRQRLRNNVLETSTIPCDYCGGRGKVRMISATSNAVLRAISFDLANCSSGQIVQVSGRSELIMYILNEKRMELSNLEKEFDAKIILNVDTAASYDSFFIDIKEQTNIKKNIANSDVSNVFRSSSDDNFKNKKISQEKSYKINFKNEIVDDVINSSEIINPTNRNFTNENKPNSKNHSQNSNTKKQIDPTSNVTNQDVDQPGNQSPQDDKDSDYNSKEDRSGRRYKSRKWHKQKTERGGDNLGLATTKIADEVYSSSRKGYREHQSNSDNISKNHDHYKVDGHKKSKNFKNSNKEGGFLQKIWSKVLD